MTTISEERDEFIADSKLVRTLIYDFKREVLSIEFIRGSRAGNGPREYHGINAQEYLQLKNAPSVGKAVMRLLEEKRGLQKPGLIQKVKNFFT